MDAAQRELNDQIDQATQRLLDDARTIPEADLRPSPLAGWTRAHVLAHVARGADAMRNLLIGARSGKAARLRQRAGAGGRHRTGRRHESRGPDGRPGRLGHGAGRAIVKQLPDEAWPVRVRVLDWALPGRRTAVRRLVEVELHPCDLGTGYSPADWPAAFATMELAEPMRSQREDRLGTPAVPWNEPAFPGPPPSAVETR